jgi:hypothetical protein
MYSIEQLKAKAPAVFRTAAEGAKAGASSRYQFIPTLDVIEDLAKFGWDVYDVGQQKSKTPETARHLVRFRHSKMSIQEVGETIPEIIFTNSHDRTKSMGFHVGLFRLVCSNGLVVADETMAKLNLRHMGYDLDQVKQLINHTTQSIPNAFSTIRDFKETEMDDSAMRAFAVRAMLVRYPEMKASSPTIVNNLNRLIQATRPEDGPDNLWTVFNRVQEKVINGHFIHVDEDNKTKQARPITNLELNIKVNTKLWELACEFKGE